MILDDIVAKKRLDLKEDSAQKPLTELESEASAMPTPKDFHAVLTVPELSIIAEVKRSSPSKGIISQSFDYQKIATVYEDGGAAAISVLTEKHFFQGSDVYLTEIKERVAIPVLRKDFIISERQVVESRAIGADAILLVAAILDDKTISKLYEIAAEYKLHCLFEAHNEKEVKRVLHCGAKIVGINNRNLQTFEVDLRTFERLRNHLPSGVLAVAESGITSAADAHRMRDCGADAILVGETLMRSADPGAMIRAFTVPHELL